MGSFDVNPDINLDINPDSDTGTYIPTKEEIEESLRELDYFMSMSEEEAIDASVMAMQDDAEIEDDDEDELYKDQEVIDKLLNLIDVASSRLPELTWEGADDIRYLIGAVVFHAWNKEAHRLFRDSSNDDEERRIHESRIKANADFLETLIALISDISRYEDLRPIILEEIDRAKQFLEGVTNE